MPRRKSKKVGLDFISDATLRRKISDAIETTSFLYLKRNEGGVSAGFASEIRRMEILYAASIIEAVLLFLFKRRNESMTRMDYKEPHILPAKYQPNTAFQLVVAKQSKVRRQERELMLDNLLDFFAEKGIIKNSLKAKIDKARRVRNTFHLSKSRKGIRCGTKAVDSANDAVIETFTMARRHLITD